MVSSSVLLTVSAQILLSTFGAVLAQSTPNRTEFPDCVNGPLATTKVCDTTVSPPERAAALVALLRPEEKLQNIIRSAS
jgi:beta-D-xylosidase 4